MQEGSIKFFNPTKGFGFITPKKGGSDIFVHISNVKYETPQDGDNVTYEIVKGKKGPSAANVRKLVG